MFCLRSFVSPVQAGASALGWWFLEHSEGVGLGLPSHCVLFRWMSSNSCPILSSCTNTFPFQGFSCSNVQPEGEHLLASGVSAWSWESLELAAGQDEWLTPENSQPMSWPHPRSETSSCARARWFPMNPQRAGPSLPGSCGSCWRLPSLVPWREVVSEACIERS